MRALIIITLFFWNSLCLAADTAATPATQTAPQPEASPAAPAPVAPVATGSLESDEELEPAKEPLKTGFLFNPNLTITSRKLEMNDQPIGQYRAAQIDAKVGYVFGSGLFAGAQINHAIGSVSGATTTDQDSTFFSVGPTVGYSCSVTGMFLSATYHAFGSNNLSGAGKYEKVNGYQIDLGYPMKVSDNFKVGPQLSLKRIDLEDGTNGLADEKIKELTPYFGLWLYF